mgnify:CR=1 FL=1
MIRQNSLPLLSDKIILIPDCSSSGSGIVRHRIRLYLRPWGVDWSDVRTGDVSGCWYEDMMPPGYDSWYARLLAQGTAQMPDSFGEGWALLREGGD